jgi:hypothetical protein
VRYIRSRFWLDAFGNVTTIVTCFFLERFQSKHKGHKRVVGVFQTGSLIRRLLACVLPRVPEMLSSLVVHRKLHGAVACKASPTKRLASSETNLYDLNVLQGVDPSFGGGGGGGSGR